MRMLGLATLNYAAQHGAYPGYLSSLRTRGGAGSDGEIRVTWLVKLLPYVERSDLYELYRNPSVAIAAGVDLRQIDLGGQVCPSAGIARRTKGALAPCSYVVNTGRADVVASIGNGSPGYPCDWPANGVFHNHFHDDQTNPAKAPLASVGPDDVARHDGTSLTVTLSERLDGGSCFYPPTSALEAEAALGIVWWPSKTDKAPFDPPHPSQRINGPDDVLPINRARPSSRHSNGVNVIFCDSHARTISDDIDYGVWCLLMTPNGVDANQPGKIELEVPGPANNYEFLRTAPIDESQL